MRIARYHFGRGKVCCGQDNGVSHPPNLLPPSFLENLSYQQEARQRRSNGTIAVLVDMNLESVSKEFHFSLRYFSCNSARVIAEIAAEPFSMNSLAFAPAALPLKYSIQAYESITVSYLVDNSLISLGEGFHFRMSAEH